MQLKVTHVGALFLCFGVSISDSFAEYGTLKKPEKSLIKSDRSGWATPTTEPVSVKLINDNQSGVRGQGGVKEKGAVRRQGQLGEQGPGGEQGPVGGQGQLGEQGPVGGQGQLGEQGPVGGQGQLGEQGPVGGQGEVDQGTRKEQKSPVQ